MMGHGSEETPTFKIILLGDSGVGKSSLTNRLVHDVFNVDHAPTLGVDFKYTHLVLKNGKGVKVQLWDTAGQEAFVSLTAQFYRGSHAVVLCYDITNRTSYLSIPEWLTRLQGQIGSLEHLPIVLAGCKQDLAEESTTVSLRQVAAHEAREWAKERHFHFFETSSKANLNVTLVFQYLSELALDQLKKGGGYFDTGSSSSPGGGTRKQAKPLPGQSPKKLGGGSLAGTGGPDSSADGDDNSGARHHHRRCNC